MEFLHETLPDAHVWWRIADPDWPNPLDPGFAHRRGGRWNPPGSFPVLYLDEDLATARLNLRGFIARWPYEPEDLRDDRGPTLVGCVLPRRQIVCDAHSPAGVRAAGLPDTYPLDEDGAPVPHTRCRPIGAQCKGRPPARHPRPLGAVPGRRLPRVGLVPGVGSKCRPASPDAGVRRVVRGLTRFTWIRQRWRAARLSGLAPLEYPELPGRSLRRTRASRTEQFRAAILVER